MHLAVLYHNGLEGSTDIVTYILFEVEHLRILDCFFQLEVKAVDSHCLHVEPFGNVHVHFEGTVELGQSLQTEYHRVQSNRSIYHQR